MIRKKTTSRVLPSSKGPKPKKDRTPWLQFIQKLWDKLPNVKRCWNCGTPIWGENSTLYWDHLLEKEIFPEYELEESNHFFCCGECHSRKTNGFPGQKHKEAIEKMKKQI